MLADKKAERRKKTVHRINRIQGQLNGLKNAVEDDSQCEDLVIQAHAIEKAMKSLLLHVVGGYFEHQAQDAIQEDPEAVLESLQRLFELSHR